MPPRRRRRRNGRVLPTVVAVIIGLAVAGGIYWHQNQDFELRRPRGLVDRVADQSSRKQVPESFAADNGNEYSGCDLTKPYAPGLGGRSGRSTSPVAPAIQRRVWGRA